MIVVRIISGQNLKRMFLSLPSLGNTSQSNFYKDYT